MIDFAFEPEFKFAKGEKVKINLNKQVGVIVERKCEYTDKENGTIEMIMKYYVKTSSYRKDWYKENELTIAEEVNEDIDKGINLLMVDGNLILGKYDMVQYWADKNK